MKSRSALYFALHVVVLMALTTALGMAALGRTAPGRDTDAKCADLTSLVIPHTQITSAQMVPPRFGLPEYCDVLGVVDPAVGFEVSMPTDWNGKFYFAGNFAFAGSVMDTSYGLARGYATASTDTGHQDDDIFDASWALDNRPAEKDFGHRAVHVTTVVAKVIVGAYYGEGPSLSYFDGCSKGGQEGLREAEQYPGDFNGVASGAPALDWKGIMVGFNWNMQALHATMDSSDIPIDKLPVIGNAVLAACDAIDGLTDGLIDDPRKCTFNPDTLRCPQSDSLDCLTDIQVGALKKIYAGPTNSAGSRLFPGFSMGGETPDFAGGGWDFWLTSTADYPAGQLTLQDQFFRYLAFQVDDPNFDWTTFNFDTDPPRMGFMAQILNATSPDLSEFHKAGGKLLLYHGWSDPVIPPTSTIAYYTKLRDEMGHNETEQFARLFMAPGMYHCGGGPGPYYFDYLTALETWVEKDIAPDSIAARHFDETGNVDRGRPLCPYPQVAHYKGSGSIDRAVNFRCASPTPK